jgi:hypothetical protein
MNDDLIKTATLKDRTQIQLWKHAGDEVQFRELVFFTVWESQALRTFAQICSWGGVERHGGRNLQGKW